MPRFPAPLRHGDRIGVTAPSSGVAPQHRARLEVAFDVVRSHGYDVVVGACMDGAGHISAPAPQRAAELTAMLVDPTIRAVVPPWGGETAIDLLPLLDWPAIAAAEPTWMVGFSDIATLITPLTLLSGVATVHGNNLMDTPYVTAPGLLSWLDVVAAAPGATLVQQSHGWVRVEGFVDYAASPGVRQMHLEQVGGWVRLDGSDPVDVSGRLIGGCIETLCNLTGTPYGNVSAWAARDAPEGVIAYVEAAGDDAATICRNLHGMRLAGFFDRAAAVLVGRTNAPALPSLSQHEATMDALAPLGVPILADVECGHVPPYLVLVNGALARVEHDAGASRITQVLA